MNGLLAGALLAAGFPVVVAVGGTVAVIIGAAVVALALRNGGGASSAPTKLKGVAAAVSKPFRVETRCPEDGTICVLVEDVLRYADGRGFDDEPWPADLGLDLDLKVTLDDEEAFAGPVAVRDRADGRDVYQTHYSAGPGRTSMGGRKVLVALAAREGQTVVAEGSFVAVGDTVADALEVQIGWRRG